MKTCFKNINLIDGTGDEIKERCSLLVEDGVITEVVEGFDYRPEAPFEIVDLDGKYIMPGLIDSHVHICFKPVGDTSSLMTNSSDTDFVIWAVKNLEALLRGGVTYIREVGGVSYLEMPLRKYLADGVIKGPGMLCSGKLITMTGGHGWFIGREADGPVEVRKAVREQLKAGADVIKIISSGGVLTPGVDVNAYQLNVDELTAAAEEAHKAGKKICTHCHSTQGIKNSIMAGIDSVEHATLIDDEGIAMALDRGTFIVPTLSAVHFIIKNGEANGIPKYAVEKAKSLADRHARNFRKAYESGVNIAMGTDAGTPFNYHGVSSAVELELMVKYGMSEKDAIVTSTKKSSELLGIEDMYGTLERGKKADFLVLNDDPLEDIGVIKNLEAVYQNGQRVLF